MLKKGIHFLCVLIFIFGCSGNKILGPDYNEVSIIAGTVFSGDSVSSNFWLTAFSSDFSQSDHFVSSNGNYAMYLNTVGTVDVEAFDVNLWTAKTQKNVKLQLGTVTELNFSF